MFRLILVNAALSFFQNLVSVFSSSTLAMLSVFFSCIPSEFQPDFADPAVPLRHALLDVGLRAELPAAAGALHHAVPRPPVGQVRPPQQALPLRQGRLGQLPEGHLRRQGA